MRILWMAMFLSVVLYYGLTFFLGPSEEVDVAPKARNMKARSKREARRPWFTQYVPSGLKGRNICSILRPFRAGMD